MVEIYKKLVFGEKNLKPEKIIEETVKLKNQKDNLFETPEQKEFNNFQRRLKKNKKNIDIYLFKNAFNYELPYKMLKYLHSLETIDDYNKAISLIDKSFGDRVRIMSKGDKKRQGNKNIGYC